MHAPHTVHHFCLSQHNFTSTYSVPRASNRETCFLLQDLPGAVSSDHESQPLPPVREGEGEEEEMEIAWRYQKLPKVQVSAMRRLVTAYNGFTGHFSQSSFSTRFGHFFDLTTSMEASRIQAVAVTTFDAMEKLAE